MRAADRHDQESLGDRSIEDAQLHWQCVAVCVDHRRYGLKAIERHRLNQFIALHRAGRRISKPQRYAVMQVIAVCKTRSETLPMVEKMPSRRRRAGRKRAPDAGRPDKASSPVR